jgi:Tol biopolymer transport system component
MTSPAWGPGKQASWTEIPVNSSAGKTTAIARLCASPDGAYLAYAESGDDGYSRAFVYDVAKRTSVALSVRRDTYPVCWTHDGSRVLFVEGNAFQGEATALMSARPDGMGRAVLVAGAGL